MADMANNDENIVVHLFRANISIGKVQISYDT